MDPMNDSAHRTIAWFDSLDEVRAVETDLEKHGIDAIHISVPSVDVRSDRNQIDRRTAGWAARRAVLGALLGASLGALVGLVLGLFMADTGPARVAFVLGGLVAGLAPGAFYAVITKLPTEPEAFDTFAVDTPGDTWIAVSGPPETRRMAGDVMRAHEPAELVDR